MAIQLRIMKQNDWSQVAALIYDSTNYWYQARNSPPIFTGPKDDALLFCQVYEALDPNSCILAIDTATNRIAGSCFYHPRPTHISLGIMNVHPDFFKQRIASQLLKYITNLADQADLPTRLVSSAINIDSYSLYSKAGFTPHTIYQDMLLTIPDSGPPITPPQDSNHVRPATLQDIPAMVELEAKTHGIKREKDIQYFINNEASIWQTFVYEKNEQILGFLVSVDAPASNMLGPGIMTNHEIATALIHAQLNTMPGQTPVWLIPASSRKLVDTMYAWGAKNCELHFAQCRGQWTQPNGIVMPTFMPETG